MANVGDSRGVLCDKDGNAIALSHDHKPYQLKERKRIKRAGEHRALCPGCVWLLLSRVSVIVLYGSCFLIPCMFMVLLI